MLPTPRLVSSMPSDEGAALVVVVGEGVAEDEFDRDGVGVMVVVTVVAGAVSAPPDWPHPTSSAELASAVTST